MTHILSAFNKTLRIRTFYRKYHYNSHLIEDLLNNTDALTQTTVVLRFFRTFLWNHSILVISKKSVQYHCRWNLNQLRSSWKLLNAIDDPYFVRVRQNTSNSDIFRKYHYKSSHLKFALTQTTVVLRFWIEHLWNLYISHLKEICPISL